MRIARALAAAALALSLSSTLAPAEAAPRPSSVITTQVTAAAASTSAKAKTKISIKASANKVKVGATVKYTGTLTRKTAKGYKPYAKQKVMLVLLADGRPILATAKTSASGQYTIKLKAEKWMEGADLMLSGIFDGNSKSQESWTGWFHLKVTKK
jgi:hypothetical protein